MSSVLGVSVGARSIHLARPDASSLNDQIPQTFEQQTVPVVHKRAEDLVAEAVGVVSASGEAVGATAIAYRSEQQAAAVRSAMAYQRLDNYQLIPESAAILEFLDSTGGIEGFSTIAVYDMGSSGLTVSVIDTATRQVRYSERTSEISGSYFDALIRDHQIAAGRISAPTDKASATALDTLCREAKEQLSNSTAVALPSDDGVVLLSRENFESLITLAVESSARLTRDVIMRSDQSVQAIVTVGGGASIPLVQNVLRRWMGMPVVVPVNPDTVAARGAALLAKPVVPAAEAAATSQSWLAGVVAKQNRKREISGAGLAATSLAVIAAIGLALGYGGQVLDHGNDSGDSPIATLPTQPSRTTTMDPSDGIEPMRTAVPVPTTSSTSSVTVPPPVAQLAPQQQAQVQQGQLDPNVVVIPGLPRFTVPTLPPPPPPPHLPPPPTLPTRFPTLPPPPPLPTFRR